jgi:hypothetical protein
MRKFKKLTGHKQRATEWLRGIALREPNLFAHWRILYARRMVKQ